MEIENQKLQQIYSTAKSLFMRYGFKRVSVEEICREANVSKMTFYKHFSNKFDLLRFILEQMVSDSFAEYREILEQDIPYSEIEKATGLSSRTVARVAKWLNRGMGGYKLMLKRIAHHNPSSLGKGVF